MASSQAVYGESKYSCPQHGVQYPQLRTLAQLGKSDWDVKCPLCSGEMEPLPADEATVNPHNQYAISKYAQELYSLVLGKRYGIPSVAMRYSIVHGPRQSFHNAYSGILRIFSLRLLNGLAPVIYEDGQQLRDYVAVSDVARANLVALQSDGADYKPFNVGGSSRTTVLEYAAMLTRVAGKEIEPEVAGAFRFGDTRHVLSDISRLGSLGWKPEASLEQAAAQYLEWVQTHVDMSDHYSEAEQVMKQQGVIRRAGE
ncbi:NAD-dependent epimerase/dehydratase family protein [Chloroflexota bacterium]